MLRRLSIALAQVKAGETFEPLSMQQYNEFNNRIIQNAYYIYEL